LLGGDGLQGDGGIAVTAAAIMEDNVNFFHGGHSAIRFLVAAKSKLHAMWIT